MSNENRAGVMSRYQMELLSNIFRVIVKEIKSDDDKEDLAPGEMGINYEEKCFYIRNPHTGELFSPNSVSHLQQLLDKYYPLTNRLNADTINNIWIYSSIEQLENLPTQFTMDSVIRQMRSPSILMAAVEHENYENLGFPCEYGVLFILKIDEEFVGLTFYNGINGTTYEGKYDREQHYFVEWTIPGLSGDTAYGNGVGGGLNVSVTVQCDIKDLAIIVVHIKEDLLPEATITVNDMPPKHLLFMDGSYINMPILAPQTLILVYDELYDGWIVIDDTQSSIRAVTQVVSQRLEDMRNDIADFKAWTIDSLTKMWNATIDNMTRMWAETRRLLKLLNQKLDDNTSMLMERPGTIYTHISVVTCTERTSKFENIKDFVGDRDYLVVNYGQTTLRPTHDYTIVGNGIMLNEIVAEPGDVFQFIVYEQAYPQKPRGEAKE